MKGRAGLHCSQSLTEVQASCAHSSLECFLFSSCVCTCFACECVLVFFLFFISINVAGIYCSESSYNFPSLRISGGGTPPSGSAVIFLAGMCLDFCELVDLCQDCRCQGMLHDVAP